LEDGVDTTLKTFTFDELDVLGGKGRRQEYIAAKAEGRLEEAGFKPTPPPEPKHVFDSLNPGTTEKQRRSSPPHRRDSHSGNRNNSEHRKPKPPSQPNTERLAKDAEKTTKPNRPQPLEGAGAQKKQHIKRRRGGRGKPK
jgi:hypothetical protein